MKRLFTFGCSLTHYIWPTWADLLSFNYDQYQNWGLCGAGNRFIFERIIEANVRYNFTKDDTIIIMWTSHQRHDYYKGKWSEKGNILNKWNNIFIDNYVKECFDPKGSVMHSLNYILSAQLILDNTGAIWYMTAINDLTIPLMEWSGVDRYFPDFTNRPIFELWPELKIYENAYENLLQRHNWIGCYDDKYNTNLYPTVCSDPKESTDTFKDHHPTPEAYYSWLKDISSIYPTLRPGDASLRLIDKWNECHPNVIYGIESLKWLTHQCRPVVDAL